VNILAIDQGTSSTKGLVLDDAGQILARSVAPVSTVPAADGGVELDPEALYRSVLDAGNAAVAAARVEVSAVGFANQGETVLAWNRETGSPAGPAISWQDRRASPLPEPIEASGQRLCEITGLPLDAYFAAPKMQWLRGQGALGVITTSDTWLLQRRTGAYVTDVTTASRTMLLDLDERDWSGEAAQIFGIDIEMLPPVVGCATVIGETAAFGGRLPVCGLAVDQQAALLGEGCVEFGAAKCTFGTGAFLLVNMGAERCRSVGGLSASVAWEAGGQAAYCLDGQVYSVGAAVDWLVQLGALVRAEDLDGVLGSVLDSGGVSVVPAFAGLGAPYWKPGAHALLEGIDLATTPAHLVRATLDGVAAQIAVLVAVVERDAGTALRSLRVDGGLSRSAAFMQLVADVTQLPVEVFPSPDATALGVAALAVAGFEGTSTLSPFPYAGIVRCIEPLVGADEAATRRRCYEQAVARVIEGCES
jgi:glycerol kinase